MIGLTFERLQDPNKVTGRLVEGLQMFYDIRCGQGNRLVDEDELAECVDNNGPIIVAYDNAGCVVSFGQFFEARFHADPCMEPAPRGSIVNFHVATLTPLWGGKADPKACTEMSFTIERLVVGLARFTAEQHKWEIVRVVSAGRQ